MIWFLFLIGLIVFLILFLTKEKKYEEISFKQSLDLTELPVITLYQGDNKFNFLLDTGSSWCLINKAIINKITYTPLEGTYELFGIEGNKEFNEKGLTSMFYEKTKYDIKFAIVDIEKSFQQVKQETGVTLHGILGSDFFTTYQYVIDFDRYVAYSKAK